MMLVASVGCFSSEPLVGSPCKAAGECGDELACIAGYCKPDSCANRAACEPFQTACDGATQGAASSSCTDVGARGCFYPVPEPDAGYCALACEEPANCPKGSDGTATPDCITVTLPAEPEPPVAMCALDCANNRQCPADMRCIDLELVGASRSLCFLITPTPTSAEQ